MITGFQFWIQRFLSLSICGGCRRRLSFYRELRSHSAALGDCFRKKRAVVVVVVVFVVVVGSGGDVQYDWRRSELVRDRAAFQCGLQRDIQPPAISKRPVVSQHHACFCGRH
jgi:hypothetical protein